MNGLDQVSVTQVEFVLPDEEQFEKFASLVCGELAPIFGQAFADPEVTRGLAEILKVSASIGAKVLADLAQENRAQPSEVSV